MHRNSVSSVTMGSPVDLSMLNINNGANPTVPSQQGMNFDFQQPQILNVQNLPRGPSPLDLALDVVKKSRQDEEAFPSFNGMGW